MIDIHCHLLPGVDDGSKSIEESLQILQAAETAGITDIILTPHYLEDTKYNCNNKEKNRIFRQLKTKAKAAKININLYLGNEVYFNEDMPGLLKQKEITTLNNSHYILVEFSTKTETNSAINYCYDLVEAGYTPVIAHPERYEYFQKDLEKLTPFLDLGCILQGDYLSLVGKFDKGAKRTLKTLIKSGKIQVLASDIHHSDDKYELEKCSKIVSRLTKKLLKTSSYNSTDELVKLLFETNPAAIINDKPVVDLIEL